MPVANIACATVLVCHRFEALNRRNDLSMGQVHYLRHRVLSRVGLSGAETLRPPQRRNQELLKQQAREVPCFCAYAFCPSRSRYKPRPIWTKSGVFPPEFPTLCFGRNVPAQWMRSALFTSAGVNRHGSSPTRTASRILRMVSRHAKTRQLSSSPRGPNPEFRASGRVHFFDSNAATLASSWSSRRTNGFDVRGSPHV